MLIEYLAEGGLLWSGYEHVQSAHEHNLTWCFDSQ
jgi:hypothetical protein